MKVTRRSPLTGELNTLDLNVTQEQMDRYAAGEELIQNIFPNLTPPEREFIKSGYTQEDWESLFGKPVSEEDEHWQMWKRIWNDEGVEVEFDRETARALREFAATVQYSAPGYEKLQDLAGQFEMDSNNTFFHRDFVCSDSDELGELVQTGSVTVTLPSGERWVVSLHAQKELP